MPVLVIDFGGTTIKFGIMESGGEIIASASHKAFPNDSLEKNLSHISQVLLAMLEQHNINRNQINAIGIAVPSIVGDDNKVQSRYVKYADAGDFDFNLWAMQEWDVPIKVENDARAALIGEWKYGAGRGYNDIALLTLGTGVGSAVISDGKLFKGKHFLAGSLTGHISVNLNGEPCNCGFFGCLETEASTWALPGIIAKHPLYSSSRLSSIEQPGFLQLFEMADGGDALANIMMHQCLKAWGTAAVNLVHSYDPEIIILSGGVMKSHHKIIPFLQKMVDDYAWLPAGTIKIEPAQQIENAGLFGMEHLANSLIK